MSTLLTKVSGGSKKTRIKKSHPDSDTFQGLEKNLVLDIYKTMVKSRALEERLIKIYKMGEAFFWIGGPGEEAFGVPLGMLSKKGHGPNYDYFHLHYRATPTVLALGIDPVHAIRLIMNKKNDICTGGRNFSNHYCFPEVNVTPVSSPIEIQYGLALGTARAQKRTTAHAQKRATAHAQKHATAHAQKRTTAHAQKHATAHAQKRTTAHAQKRTTAHAQKRATTHAQKRTDQGGGISIVTGGDAGTAEGDFASCLIWASRPGEELPILITVQNNAWGISTPYSGQHGEESISDRGKAFQIKSLTINGNDPIESYIKLKECMDYIRKEQKPVLLEAHVSRLFGHSSASGANLKKGVFCPIENFRDRLIKAKWLTDSESIDMKKSFEDEFYKIFKEVQKEKGPSTDSIWQNTFVNNENADWRAF